MINEKFIKILSKSYFIQKYGFGIRAEYFVSEKTGFHSNLKSIGKVQYLQRSVYLTVHPEVLCIGALKLLKFDAWEKTRGCSFF